MFTDSPADNPMEADLKQHIGKIMETVEKTMYGMDEVTRLCLIALYCRGHVLLEGNPGLGKTKLVRTLEQTLRLPYKRIQFTPDLMPTDITGSKMPDENERQKLRFQPGPIFTTLLLADEINRASPKTQAAMLEAMAEGEVTVQGATHQLGFPFMVLATQNPVDHEGTYPLPEAQADRFMFKIAMPFPKEQSLRRIIQSSTGPLEGRGPRLMEKQQLTVDEIKLARKRCWAFHKHIRAVQVTKPLETHVVNLLLASNGYFSDLLELSKDQVKTIKKLVDNLLLFGLGPRAAENLVLGSKAQALMFLEERDGMAGPEALAGIVIPTLRHRLKLVYDWEERYCRLQDIKLGEEESREGLLDALLAQLCDATAPDQAHLYRESFREQVRGRVDKKWLDRGGLLR